MSDLSAHQAEQLRIATSEKIGILTGSAGTGKSHCVQKWLETLTPGSYAVCTPTGKAAVRLNSEMDCGARTIHRLLGVQRNGHDGGGWSFMYNRSLQLPFETIVIDEGFMPSTDTMSQLFQAAKTGAQILITGDPNQLPPVGHGRPTYDMMMSGAVAHGHLSEVWRYSGRIAQVANAIKDGKPWKPSTALDPDAESPENYRHLESSLQVRTMADMKLLIDRMEQRGFHPLDDVQVLCWKNTAGGLSRKKLNAWLQQQLNPDGETADRIPFRIGDKVICNKNHFRATETPDGEEPGEAYLANGETGRITGFSQSKGKKPTINGCLIRFGRQTVKAVLGETGLGRFELAYAITVHKSQGSQSPVIIVVADDSAGMVAGRQGIYTAFTRASKMLFSVGKMSTLLQQCRRQDLSERTTLLKERLQRSTHRRREGSRQSLIADI